MIYLIIIDGLGDDRIGALNNKTPFEFAKKPNIDFFIKNGKLKEISISKFAPESDVGVLKALGSSLRGYTGRGVLELLGTPLKFKNGDLALRANFATIANGKIIDRRVGRTLTTREAKILEKALNKIKIPDAKIKFLATSGHRGVLHISSNNLSSNISNTDPAYKKIGYFSKALAKPSNAIQFCRPLIKSARARKSAEIINSWLLKAKEVLEKSKVNLNRRKKGELEANWILLRDASDKLPKFKKNYKNFFALAAMPLEKGIAKSLGMRVLKFNYSPKVESDPILRLKEEIFASKRTIKKFKARGIYIHFKPIDEISHDGDYKLKVKAIEMVDDFFKALKAQFDFQRDLLILTGDHSTSCLKKAHTAGKVPMLIAGKAKIFKNYFQTLNLKL